MSNEEENKNLGDNQMGVAGDCVTPCTLGPFSSSRFEGIQDSGSGGEVSVGSEVEGAATEKAAGISAFDDLGGSRVSDDGLTMEVDGGSDGLLDWGGTDRALGAGEEAEGRLDSNSPDDQKLIDRVERIRKYEAARLLLISGMDYTEVCRLLGIPRNKARYLSNATDEELARLSLEKMKEILAIHLYQFFTNRSMYQQEYLLAIGEAKKEKDTDRVIQLVGKMINADKSFAWILNQAGVAALYKAAKDPKGKGGTDQGTIKDTLNGLKRTKRRLLRPRHRRPMEGDTLRELEANGEGAE